MPDNFQVRDVFNPKVVNELADNISGVWREFDAGGFRQNILPRLPEMTFSERSQWITDALIRFLPIDFPAALDILLKALPSPLETDELEGYDRFIIVPMTMYVSHRGMEHFDLSMQALYEMTKRFSAEGAIRYFIEKHPEKTLAILAEWAKDSNAHVRRLVSEGTRPLLPWTLRLKQFVADPQPTLRLLELLKNDPALYVRRSVANHLNDHAKNHPDAVVTTLQRWKNEHPGTDMDWLIRHATRTLIKQGHPAALELLGFAKGAAAYIEHFQLTPKTVKMGSDLEFSFDIVSTAAEVQKLVIDYVIYFKKANGVLTPKVFKLTTKTLLPAERLTIQKRHPFREITTRVYYSGTQQLTIQINGEEGERLAFKLAL